MKLSTINYIQDLLVKEEDSVHNQYKIARDNWLKAKETESPSVVRVLETKKIDLWDEWSESKNALEDFNAHDWR